MGIEEFIKMFSPTASEHGLRADVMQVDQMESGVAKFVSENIKVRLLTDRGQPWLEFGHVGDDEWFDVLLLGNELRPPQEPLSSARKQISLFHQRFSQIECSFREDYLRANQHFRSLSRERALQMRKD